MPFNKVIMLQDTYRHKGLRRQLLDTLRNKGIKDERILEAFSDIPRHYFLSPEFADWAYRDVPFDIGLDQTISQPYTVARMTELLEIKPNDKVLEIGTGSGFQACVLAYLGAKVYTIERHRPLYESTKTLLMQLGFDRIRTLFGDGYAGNERFAPYDKIIVTAGATEIPKTLFDQLANRGQMLIPIGPADKQTMYRITKIEGQKPIVEDFGPFIFVPFLPGTNLG